jgi:hypothetical protein
MDPRTLARASTTRRYSGSANSCRYRRRTLSSGSRIPAHFSGGGRSDFGQQRQRRRLHADLSPLGLHDRARRADDVAEVEVVEQRPRRVVHGVPRAEQLEVARAVPDHHEGHPALVPEQHDPPGHRLDDVGLLGRLEPVELLQDVGRVGVRLEVQRERRNAPVREPLQRVAAGGHDGGQAAALGFLLLRPGVSGSWSAVLRGLLRHRGGCSGRRSGGAPRA